MTISEMRSAKTYIEWGYWLLWIFAGVAVGIGSAELLTVMHTLTIGTVIGGVVVGFMPWLARKWNISRIGWWMWNGILVISITIGLIAFIVSYPDMLQYPSSRTVSIFIGVEGVVAALIVACIARWMCRRWMEHIIRWWMWATGTILILVVLAFFAFAYLITALAFS